MKRVVLSAMCLFTMLSLPFQSAVPQDKAAQSPLISFSKETGACIDCHKTFSPGIVEDWLQSRHARVTPEEALKKVKAEQRVSGTSIPEHLQKVAVGCYECHSLNPKNHKDNFEHFDYRINTIVSPGDCKTCHEKEVDQYGRSKKAHALSNLDKNSLFSLLVETIAAGKIVRNGKVLSEPASVNAKDETCYACHGTEVTVKGMKRVVTALGDIEVPDLAGVPNHGVGRVNPDGTSGSCSACHARHAFSIEVARKPYTCAQCHVEPDVPAWNVYKESKHGSIFLSTEKVWNFDRVPWVVGRDFKAPTCASCHNSLVVNPDGEVVRERTHDFGERLWVRIFGLIYSHPQPKDGKTYLIKNKDGLPLPTTFTGEAASAYLIDVREQQQRQGAMEKLCTNCHSSLWTGKYFDKFHASVGEADRMVAASTGLLASAWSRKLAHKTNPFDEQIEQKWLKQWLFYGNSVRYSAAMGGPDYATFKNGWWNLTTNMEDMRDYLKRTRQKR
jgi:hydroxylamine dehydrogenase